MKYFLYARKSTEDEERQIMSIEAQLAELAEYAKRENITISEQFIESKSAKKPGREIFNRMMSKVHDSKEPIGLIAWHPDRLARNSVDGGQIIYSIDIGKITSLRFPTFWFEPTPQGLFMLQVAFGQSKYYSDNLSENVKRGIRQKLRRGEWPSRAPFGYINNPKTRNIEPDPFKSKLVKIAFEEFATGNHTYESLGKRLEFLGVVGKFGRPLCKVLLHRMLINKVYLGIIEHKGEDYEGNFEPIVSRAAFTAVQEVLSNGRRVRVKKKKHGFPFLGLLKCGECGGAITAQLAKGNGGIYTYYRCTKKLGKCGQKYLGEKKLVNQLTERLEKVALSDDWKEKMLSKVEIWKKENTDLNHDFAQNLETKIKEAELKLDKLVNAYLDGTIEKDIYLAKKNELVQTKTDLLEKKSDFGRKGNNWLEPLRKWIIDANYAKKLALSKDFMEIKSFTEKIGTNRRLLNREVVWEWREEWKILADFNAEFKNLFLIRASALKADALRGQESLCMSGYRDSNPESHEPESCALANWAIPR